MAVKSRSSADYLLTVITAKAAVDLLHRPSAYVRYDSVSSYAWLWGWCDWLCDQWASSEMVEAHRRSDYILLWIPSPFIWIKLSKWRNLYTAPVSVGLVCYLTNFQFYILNWRNSWRYYLYGKWIAGRGRSTILQQWNLSFGEILDRVHFSCRRLCWKVTKYDVHIFWLIVFCSFVRSLLWAE